MSELGKGIMTSLLQALGHLEKGEDLGDRYLTTTWQAIDAKCGHCGGNLTREHRTEPSGMAETTIFCRSCNPARGEEAQ